MERLSRAGRKRAIVDAIKRLEKTSPRSGYRQGEICRKMGITSQSKIRDILHEMVREQKLLIGGGIIDGYQHEIDIYAIARFEQMPLPTHTISINGVNHQSDEWRYSNV